MDNKEKIISEIQAFIEVGEKILSDEGILDSIEKIASVSADCIKKNKKILLCGNGGSASDSLHIAGELVGRFKKERRAFSVLSLNSDVAVMTAIANDYGYEEVFSRQVEGLMDDGDILIGISTSGNSENVFKAFESARAKEGTTVLLSGKSGGKIREISDYSIIVPSEVTSHIQEAHECIYHILCGLIEDILTDGSQE